MITIETLTTFFGWCSAINLTMMVVAAIALVPMRGLVAKIHNKMSGLSEQELARAYFQYLAQYKTAILVLNLAPYLALKIMA